MWYEMKWMSCCAYYVCNQFCRRTIVVGKDSGLSQCDSGDVTDHQQVAVLSPS